MTFEMIFFAVFFGIVAYFAYSAIRHGGFKGALFGAKILSSVGEISCAKRGLMSQKLKVHILDSDDPVDRSVGLELTSSGPGAWSMTPINLSSSEARRLISLLEEAITPVP